ncbi:hypothetical protein NLU13_4015 [Sarocladium strictum]|uniref:MICOS complex subunit mic19 n=1 Tax=Sarocladium strictum TaxID=5046 RepID=A0AA39L8E7_SARSR|nr:hypothetical protein NLU13_4015 [Sarocladium strictum]
MGASESKPASAHIWKTPGPSGVSQDLVESLQSNHETDASRAKAIELEVQARVAQELKKLHAQSSQALNQAHEAIASSTTPEPTGPSHQSISKEVNALRQKLEERKKIRELPAEVESARNGVVQCLRDNDRRPLDCWEQVEKFKAEVKKLEKGWVDKVTS